MNLKEQAKPNLSSDAELKQAADKLRFESTRRTDDCPKTMFPWASLGMFCLGLIVVYSLLALILQEATFLQGTVAAMLVWVFSFVMWYRAKQKVKQ